MIELISEIGCKNNGSFALVDDSVIRGGLRCVTTFEELADIPADRLKDGCLAVVKSPIKQIYTYNATDNEWTVFSSGGGDGGAAIYDDVTSEIYTWSSQKIASELEERLSLDDVDNVISPTSKKPVQNKVIAEALEEKISKDDVDSAISPYSKNPVQNKVIAEALENVKAGKTMTAEEYDALDDETKNDGSFYYISDTGEIYQNNVLFGGGRTIECTFEEYKQLEADGLVEPDVDYVIVSDEKGILLASEDVGYKDKTVHEALVTLEEDVITTNQNITKHSLPLVFDSGIINNSTVQVYKLTNVGYTASGGTDAYNLNLLLSSRGAEEIELIGGKNDGSWIIEAIRNNKSFNKITNIYQDGLDIYVRLDLRCNYFRVYHKSGVLSGDFAVSLVDTIPETVTELTIRPHPTYINDSVTDVGSTWSSNKIASEITNNTNATYLIRDIVAGGENVKTVSFKIRKDYFASYYAKRTFLLSANIYSLGFSKPVIGLVEIYRSTTDSYSGYVVNLQDTRYTGVTVTVNGNYLEVVVTFNSYESSGCMVSCSSLSNVPIA